jgi:hypothetical protein
MAPDTIIMICLICVGCALGIAGLAIAGHHGRILMKAAQKSGFKSRADVQDVIRRAQELGPRIQETQQRLEAVAKRLQVLSATANSLQYLRDELDRATGRLSQLKF